MPRKSVSNTERGRLFLLHGGRCHLCNVKIDGVRERWELEHVIPYAISRDDSDENRKPAHVKCHAEKTTKDRKTISKTDRMRMKNDGTWRSKSPMRRWSPEDGRMGTVEKLARNLFWRVARTWPEPKKQWETVTELERRHWLDDARALLVELFPAPPDLSPPILTQPEDKRDG